MAKSPHKRTSEVLQDIINTSGEGSITIGQFTGLLGDRAFALAILIFSLPNSLPLPGIPGFSTLTGLPIVFIALQMMAGRDTIWLPQKVADRQFAQHILKRLLTKAMPAVVWMERYLCPRMDWACSALAERLLGVLFIALALIIALPIPGGNFLPGLSMSLIALGLLEKDGLFVACAVAFSVMSIALMYKVIVLFFTAIIHAVAKIF